MRCSSVNRAVLRFATATTALTAMGLLTATAAFAQSALPTGGQVVQGSATIGTNGTTTTVTQASDRAVVNWAGFDVAQDKAVVFAQPGSSSATLNRVTGAAGSTIAGSITSNGAVYLVNPNGIAITATGTVQTGGGFVASTLGITDADFMSGTLNFTGTGASAIVKNRGSITAGAGGYVALLGGTVNDSGTITVPLGRVGLASGESVALDLNGDGFLRVAVPTASIAAGSNALIEMTGQIAAAGGRVVISAASARDAVRNIVNVPGSISADSATGSGGSIVLLGGDGGTTRVSGTLTARATGASGNGGLVETSGADVDFVGLKVDTSAVHGTTGLWLIDPTDLNVDASAANTISNNLSFSNVTLQTNADGTTSGPGTRGPGTGGDININAAINWVSSPGTLTLNAYRDINIFNTLNGEGLVLNAGRTISQSSSGAVNVSSLSGSAGADVNLGSVANRVINLRSFTSTGGRFSLNNGVAPLYVGGALNAAGQTVTLTTTNANGMSQAGGGTITAGTLTADSGGPIQFGAFGNAIATLGAITAKGAVTVVSGQALTVAGPVNISTAGGSLYLNALNSALTWSAPSSTVGSSVVLDGGGAITLNTGINATQGITFNRAVVLGAGVTLNPGEGATATFSRTLDGAQALRINGAATFNGAVGQTSPLTSLTTLDMSGLTTVNGVAVTTSGAQTYAAATFGSAAPSSLTSTGGTIGFTGAVTANNSLSLTATGITLPASVSSTGTLTLAAGPGTIAAANTSINVNTFALTSGVWQQNAAALPGFTATNFNLNPAATFLRVTGGDGSSATPYTVTDAFGLQGIASGALLTKSFALANNISLASTATWNGGLGWVAIGTDGAANVWNGTAFAAGGSAGFTGLFDGGGYAVSGLTIARSVNFQGLFGYASNSASFSNLTLTGLSVAGGSGSSVGGLIGFTSGSSTARITGVSVAGSVSGSQSIGGLAGSFAGTITGSNAAVRVIGSSSIIGGLVGSATNATLTDVYATGDINQNGSTVGTVGGLVGMMNGGTVGASVVGGTYATGNVYGGTTIGGLIGTVVGGGTVTNARASGAVTGSGTGVGGLIGSSGSGGAITSSTASGAVTGNTNVGGLIGQASKTSGSAVIDQSSASGTVTAKGIVAGGLVGALNGYTVSNSFATGAVNATSTGIHTVGGLVGQSAGNSSTLSGSISNSYATGDVSVAGGSPTNSVGGLVGSTGSFGAIVGSYATGNVTVGQNTTSNAIQYVGGLVGQWNGGSAAVTISNSFATGAVTVAQALGTIYIGGLAGRTSNFGLHGSNWASGSVSYTGTTQNASVYMGGLIGVANSGITRSYATGAVNGNGVATYVGGLLGQTGSPLTESYASGAVSGGLTQGGLVGNASNANSVASSNYWDTYSTGQTAGIGSGQGAPQAVTSDPGQAGAANYAYKTSAYANFTPANWVFFDGQTRPFGAWEVPAVGTALTNAHQVQLIGANATTLAGSFTLGGNINLAETGANQGTAATSAGMWSQLGFVPLGSDGTGGLWNGNAYVPVAYYQVGNPGVAAGFSGSLIGGGFTLSNLGINRAGAQNVGLFGGSSGIIRNLTVTGNVTGYVSTGGVVGLMQGGTISGVTSAVNVTGGYGSAYVGGLVGFASGAAIAASSASGAVSADGAAGGLVGLLYNSTLTNSTSSATVTGRAGKSGSVVGIVERSTATGNTSTGTTNGAADTPYGALRDGGTYN